MPNILDQIAQVASNATDPGRELRAWALSKADCITQLNPLQWGQFTNRLGEFDVPKTWIDSTLKPAISHRKKELTEQKQRSVIEYIGTKTDETNTPPLEEMLTEFGVARRFANKFGQDFRYVPGDAWYFWTGTHWKQDTAEIEISKAIKSIIQILWDEAENHVRAAGKLVTQMKVASGKGKPTDELDKQYKEHLRKADETKKFAASSQKSRFMQGVIASAKTENLTIEYDVFNNDAWLLNCRNGTVDLRTGDLRPHERADYLTWVIGIDFDPTADATLWEKTIIQIMGGDEAMAAFLRRLFGYAITGTCKEKAFGVFWGALGDNAKTFLFEVLRDILGESLANSVSEDVLIKSDKHGNAGAATPHLMQLENLRIAWASESNEGRRLEVGQVKKLTGRDSIPARQLREAFVTLTPKHTLFLITNHKPHVPADDNAIWNRLKLVEFNQQFVHNPDPNKPHQHKVDTALNEKLTAEAQGIITWLVLGALEWQQSGLQPPDKVTTATNDYRKSEDTLGQFIEEECATGKHRTGINAGKDYEVGKEALYKAYQSWCNTGGMDPMSSKKFYTKLEERGYKDKRITAGKVFTGIELKNKLSAEEFKSM